MDARDVLTWRRWLAVAAALVLAVGWRFVRDDVGAPANLELVTAASFFSMVLLRHRAVVFVPLVVAMTSDLLLGNTAVLAFTWTAWAVVGLGALAVRRPRAGWRRYAVAAGFGAGASVWFFLWTNAGVWFLGRGTWYASGWDGLVASYAAGLPFLRPMLLGNLVLLPLAAVAAVLVERWERGALVAASTASPRLSVSR